MDFQSIVSIRQTPDRLLWRGENPQTHERRLIRSTTPSGATRESVRQELAEEFRFLGQLSHAGLLRPVAITSDASSAEYEDIQGSMRMLLEETGALDADLVANVLRQAFDALAYLHGKGLLHGFISCETLLISPTGQLRFGDFIGSPMGQGIRPRFDENPRYQAPEVIDSTRGIPGPASDFYCLGFAALEMLAGDKFEKLFGIEEAGLGGRVNWLAWHADPFRELSGLRESLTRVPEALIEMILTMIRKDPLARGAKHADAWVKQIDASGLGSRRALPFLKYAGNRPDQDRKRPTKARKRRRKPKIRLVWSRNDDTPPSTFDPTAGVLVGRGEGCELLLSHASVSAKHALMICGADTRWFVCDLHSSSGTWINGVRIAVPTQMRNGDEVRFGERRAIVDVQESAAKRGTALRRIGQFYLQKKLYAGHNGVLYRATWQREEGFRTVALRIYPQEFSKSPEMVRRFLRGVPLAANLRSNHIVRLFRGGSFQHGSKKHWYLAMELMEGGSLRDRLAVSPGKPLPMRAALQMGIEICSALITAAQANLVHRNIHPGSILFTKEDQARLSDFVLIRTETLDEGAMDITSGGVAPGDVIYQAPEVLTGVPLTGPECDIYSLGACLYEALTGRLPFLPNGGFAVMAQAIMTQMPPAARSINAVLPEEVERLLAKALDKKPNRRYATAQEMQTALSAILGAIPPGKDR